MQAPSSCDAFNLLKVFRRIKLGCSNQDENLRDQSQECWKPGQMLMTRRAFVADQDPAILIRKQISCHTLNYSTLSDGHDIHQNSSHV